ncbi:MAG TPA: maleylpyruvate isomerase N-terminal domain-containing protein [Anaerolineaceae bacterium]|nr:maleylpyruvate isomerase N-terminal domain-containing protein [Anaerolineaceae bacterium]
MTMQDEIIRNNSAGRIRLAEFARSLTDAQLETPMPAGWTVSAVLAHVAFWDLRASAVLEKLIAENIAASPADTDVINEATRPLCLAIPPRDAVELAISAAECIDDQIEHLTPELLKAVSAPDLRFRLDRAHHRLMHMDEISAVLKK